MKKSVRIGLVLSLLAGLAVSEALAGRGGGGQRGGGQQAVRGRSGSSQYSYGAQTGAMRGQMMQNPYSGMQPAFGSQMGAARQQRLKDGSCVGQSGYGMQGGMMGQGNMQGGMMGQGRMQGDMMGQGSMQGGTMGQGRMQGGIMGQGSMQGGQRAGRSGSGDGVNTAATSGPLSQQEIDDLLLMREEEKLAHDVYLTLDAKWNVPVLAYIAQSESRHMAALKGIIQKYGLQDPVVDDTLGAFTNPELVRLYNDLVQTGSASVADAYGVGVRIEELDIEDSRKALTNVTHADVRRVYENLTRASQNHLKAFTSQL